MSNPNQPPSAPVGNDARQAFQHLREAFRSSTPHIGTMNDPLAAFISAAVFAKLCGAADPVAVVEEASRRFMAEPLKHDDRQGYLDHLRLIQELSEAQS